MENWLCHSNIQIVGMPEKAEGKHTVEFIESWLMDTFGKNNLTPFFYVESAHRVPPRASPPRGNDRPFLLKLLHGYICVFTTLCCVCWKCFSSLSIKNNLIKKNHCRSLGFQGSLSVTDSALPPALWRDELVEGAEVATSGSQQLTERLNQVTAKAILIFPFWLGLEIKLSILAEHVYIT